MKITGVGAIPLAIPLAPSTPESSWAAGIGKQILVRMTTDDGLIGWGECFAYGAPLAVCNVVDDALAPLLVGQDAIDLERLTQVMHRALMIWGRRGLGMCAVSGVELALWDLAGKAQRVPVHRLLGGLNQARVRAYASLLRYDTASDVGRVCQAMVGQGYTAIKLHQIDVESVAVARDAVGDGVDLMLDTNCPWPVEEAIRIGRLLEPYNLRWLEEPVWPPEDYASLAQVRRALRIPIASGENDATVFGARELIAAGQRHEGRRARRDAQDRDPGGGREHHLPTPLVLFRAGPGGDGPSLRSDTRCAVRRDAAGRAASAAARRADPLRSWIRSTLPGAGTGR